MSKFFSRRSIVLGAVLSLAIAGAAIAYWTAGGSGTGSASAAGAQSALTANQSGTLTAMYPGDSAQTLSGTFTNTNDGPIHVTSVTASIASVSKATGAAAGTCDATDFTLASPVMSVNTDVPVDSDVGAFSGATIKFNDKASNQDACKGATVNLAYAIA